MADKKFNYDYVWGCKIVGDGPGLSSHGADIPMRAAVVDTFIGLTGSKNVEILSGWGIHLNEVQKAIIENRDITEPYGPEFDLEKALEELVQELREKPWHMRPSDVANRIEVLLKWRDFIK